jgi:endonuclease III
MAAAEPLLDRLADRLRGLKPPCCPAVFEALVNAVACQQLSLGVGIHLLNRLTAAYGRPVPGAVDGLHAFPRAQELATAAPGELRRLGFSRTKANTIVDVARATTEGTLDLEALRRLDDSEALTRLTGLRGVGPLERRVRVAARARAPAGLPGPRRRREHCSTRCPRPAYDGDRLRSQAGLVRDANARAGDTADVGT